MKIEEQLKQIVPGETYPRIVIVREDGGEIRFLLQSYFVGMYCAAYLDGQSLPCQTGDRDNKKFVAGLKKDLKKAIARGASVEIGRIDPIKKEM